MLVEVDWDLDALAGLFLVGGPFGPVDPLEVGARQEAGEGLAELDALLVASVGGALDREALHDETEVIGLDCFITGVNLELKLQLF